jgi:hypothetical protein
VFEITPTVTAINLSGCNLTGKNFPAPFIRGPKSPLRTFPRPSFAGQSADDPSANLSQVTLLSWPNASRLRNYMHRRLKSGVSSIPHPSFADQSSRTFLRTTGSQKSSTSAGATASPAGKDLPARFFSRTSPLTMLPRIIHR